MDLPEPSPPLAGDSAPPASPPSNGPLSGLHFIFTGPNGIRAGWRLLIFTVIAFFFLIVLAAPALLLSRQGAIGGAPDPASVILSDAVPFLALILAARIMAEIEGRALSDYGLPLRGAYGRRFWRGVLWGFAALSAVLGGIAAGHGFSLGRLAVGGSQGVYYAGVWALGFLVVAFFEEFLMRGYALFTLASGIGFWPAAILLSIPFGAGHIYNPGENWVGATTAVFMGLLLCLVVRRTGDLWFAIGLHAAWDYAQSFVYSVPDSGVTVRGHLLNASLHGPGWLTGGTVGPEASALTFVVLAALFLALNRVYPEARFPGAAKPHLSDPRPAINPLPPGGLGL